MLASINRDKILPVDLYVVGCPPRPDTFIHGLLMLQEAVGKEKRPLSWLAGIEVPERAKVIRIMVAELFRMSNHLVWYGIFVQDVGQLSPVFYMFTDRERFFGIIEAICG